MTDMQRVAATTAIVGLLTLALVGLAWRAEPPAIVTSSSPTPAAAPIVPPASLDSLLAEEASAIRAPGVSPALKEAADAVTSVEGGAGGGMTVASDAASPTPHLLTVTPPVRADSAHAADFTALASCGPSCWGERMTRGEVEALALSVTGDAAWSAWAGRCFSRPGAESGGYPQAVGGPNADGSWDLGIVQMNTVHAAWADMERVLADPAYALRMAYRLHRQQGAGAWYGCDGGVE